MYTLPMITRMPSLVKCLTVSYPIPLAPPVTTATFPFWAGKTKEKEKQGQKDDMHYKNNVEVLALNSKNASDFFLTTMHNEHRIIFSILTNSSPIKQKTNLAQRSNSFS